MKPDNHRIKSTILYYPTINIPDNVWLRKALLYWDEIGSIVPKDYKEEPSIEFSPELAYLMQEGVYRPFDPSNLSGHWELLRDFEREFFSIIKSEQYQQLIGDQEQRLESRIHKHKVSDVVINRLIRMGLASKRENSNWLNFETITSYVYISLLAKYLSQIDAQSTIPGSNWDVFQDLVYRSQQQNHGIAGLSINLLNILPVPREDVPFETILDFKRKREHELLNFRKIIHDFQQDYRGVESMDHMRQIVQKHQENILLGLSGLVPRFIDDGLPLVFGSLKSIMSATSPTFWGTGLVLAEKATDAVNIPLNYEIAGLTIMGAIQLGDYLISELNDREKVLSKSQLSFLLAAQQEGII